MRSGKTLPELAAQIKSEQEMKRDFVAPTNLLNVRTNIGGTVDLQFSINGEERIARPTRLCMNQICERVGIPQKYADRMTGDSSDLLAHNINHWFQRTPENRMLRTLQNGQSTARAFLSDRYRPFDNADLAQAVLPALFDSGCEVVSSEITEKRLYIQATTPKLIADVSKSNVGDIVQAGVVVSNSEVGCGSLRVEPMIFRVRCRNGLIAMESIKRYHVGRGGDELDAAAEYFSDATRQLDDKAFWAKVVDVVNGVFDKDRFASMAEKFAATGAVSLASPTSAVTLVEAKFGLTKDESKSVLDHLIAGGDPTLFGLVNAVTRTAEDVVSYDRAIEFERMGGQVMELPPTIWGNN